MDATNATRTGRILLLVVAGCLLGSRLAAADNPSRFRIVVVAILATDRNTEVDPKLACIAREVQKMDPKLTGFHLKRVSRKSLSISSEATFPLVDDERVTVVLDHGPNAEQRVGLRVKASGVGEIAYETKCSKCFPIVTRYQTKDKDRLIIAVEVRPCPKK